MIQVQLLDCDSIDQAKEKILKAIFKVSFSGWQFQYCLFQQDDAMLLNVCHFIYMLLLGI